MARPKSNTYGNNAHNEQEDPDTLDEGKGSENPNEDGLDANLGDDLDEEETGSEEL